MSDRRLVPTPVGVDWGILAAVCLAVTTGALALFAGRPGLEWLVGGVVVVHGVAGVALVGLVVLKLARVWRRVRPEALTPARGFSVLLAALALAALATGVAWVLGVASPLAFWTLLTLHMWLGVATLLAVAVHLGYRRWPLATAGRESRRNALQYLGLVAAGAVAWRLQQVVSDERRFTGSRERGSGAGNAFPVTSWVADDPDPVDPEEWSLSVGGLVDAELSVAADELSPEAGRRVALDCTSGWYSVHDWRGLRVGDLLEEAGAAEDARWVQFRSVTGYRWSLPLAEARDALLATHVEDERLDHGHGFPLRLVAPGRRGFQWVKWVERVEVRRTRDLSEWVAIHRSGFDRDA